MKYRVAVLISLSAAVAVPRAGAAQDQVEVQAFFTGPDEDGQMVTIQGSPPPPSGGDTANAAAITSYAFYVAPSARWDGWFNLTCVINGRVYPVSSGEILSVRNENYGLGGGGHNHALHTRPVGTWSPDRGILGTDRRFHTSYTAGAVAGNEYIVLHGRITDPASPCNGRELQYSWIVTVRQRGLVPLRIGRFMLSRPVTYGHSYALAVAVGMDSKLALMAEHYFTETRRYLRVHTASLPQGGLFDTGEDYREPWSDHQDGLDVDVSGGDAPNAVVKLIDAGARAGLQCMQKGLVVHCRTQ